MNIASIIAFIANINISPYACTKAGVMQMTKAFSNEWSSKGICVNAICPGYFVEHILEFDLMLMVWTDI